MIFEGHSWSISFDPKNKTLPSQYAEGLAGATHYNLFPGCTFDEGVPPAVEFRFAQETVVSETERENWLEKSEAYEGLAME